MCRSATSFALFKDVNHDPANPSSVASGIKVDKSKMSSKQKYAENKIYMADFERALSEIKPLFGMDNTGLENKVMGGFYSYGSRFDNCINKCTDFINEIRSS